MSVVSVCLPSDALLQHLPSYLGFSYLGRGVSLLWLLQQSAVFAPYLGGGVSPHRHPSWPSTWDSSSRPSCTLAATTPWTWGLVLLATAPGLRCGVSPPCRRPWPQSWGHGVAPPGHPPPDLGSGVAPLRRSCAVAVWHSGPLPLTSDVG